jgi:hypothetical protein
METTNGSQIVFYIVREKSDNPTQDFPNFIYLLKNSFLPFDIIQETPNIVSITSQSGYKGRLEYLSGSDIVEELKSHAFICRLTINSEDSITLSNIRDLLFRQKDNYRVFNWQRKAFMPKDPDIICLDIGSHNLKTFEVLAKFNLSPTYFSQRSGVYYAEDKEKRVRIVNPYLLDFIYDKPLAETDLPELNYPVSPSMEMFATMYDRGLVPVNFYEYYGKPTKIINQSFFDINNPDRKVFVKPYVLEFKVELGDFYTLAGPEGGALLVMTKIQKGENLDDCLKRHISQELKISDDYLGAFVSPHIEFDRDRDGILTPRIIVLVYVDKINDPNRTTQMSQTGWKSLGKNSPDLKQIKTFDR